MSKHSYKPEELPGRKVRDSERSPFGLGWEYARRVWGTDGCPYTDEKDIKAFNEGYRSFKCSNPDANDAMIKLGVEMDSPTETARRIANAKTSRV